MTARHRHHGNIFVGRVMVVAACLLVLWVNALIFKEASAPEHPLPVLKVVTVMSLVWMFTGALGVCGRMTWGRPLMLTILYAGSFAAYIWGLIILATADRTLAGGLKATFIATVVYLIMSLVMTHSKHVRRLTSRAYE
jgi:hypothetical protein